MSASTETRAVAQEGMRVHVFSPNQKDNWGLGTIVQVEADGYPREIRLDNGRTVEGSECWWHPVTRELITDLVKRVVAKRMKTSPAKVGDGSLCQTPGVVFCRVTEDAFGATNVVVRINESLTVSELARMIWQYVA